MRERAERRKNDYKKAIRKKNIVEKAYGWEEGRYNNLHQYSKNKIHCSCPLCAAKSDMNDKMSLKHSDRIKIESMNSQLNDI